MGPCMCGDPYCPFCGNPAAAAYADFVEDLLEKFQVCLDEADQSIPDPGLAALDAMEMFLERHLDEIVKTYNASMKGP